MFFFLIIENKKLFYQTYLFFFFLFLSLRIAGYKNKLTFFFFFKNVLEIKVNIICCSFALKFWQTTVFLAYKQVLKSFSNRSLTTKRSIWGNK